MLLIENTDVVGWEAAIRGMRNPMNSWSYSDSSYDPIIIGKNDLKLMTQLDKGGPVHAKYRRMITVYCDVVAPLYWWKEYETYKVGTVTNSCSTMHKIQAKKFNLDDFSHEHLSSLSINHLEATIEILNMHRNEFIDDSSDKDAWWQMIQLLPSSYNQRRTLMMNYEVLAGLYPMRKDHKLDEWHTFCKWIESLPYSELITGRVETE